MIVRLAERLLAWVDRLLAGGDPPDYGAPCLGWRAIVRIPRRRDSCRR